MAFLNPALLWGSLAFLIPLIIYLIFRRRVVEMDWAAIQFLLDLQKQQKKLDLEELLLLLLRMLMLALLGFALARPLLGGALFGGGGSSAVAIDHSASMQTRSGVQSRFEAGQEAAATLIDEQPGGTGLALLSAAELSQPIIRSFTKDHELVAETIRGLDAGYQLTDPVSELRAIRALFEHAPDGARSTYLVSDFQQAYWQNPNDALKRELASLNQSGSVTFIPVGEDGLVANCAAHDLRLAGGTVRAGTTARLIGEVSNLGSEPVTNLTIDLLVDGQVFDTRQVAVAAESTSQLTFSAPMESSGWHRCEMRIRHDANPGDNAAYLAIEAGEGMRILAIAPPPTPGNPPPTVFLELALNPFAEGSEHPEAGYRFIRREAADLAVEDLDTFDAIVIADTADIDTGGGRALTEYIRRGGGVMLFLGPDTIPASYNTQLYADGEGPLAWPLAESPLIGADEDTPIPFRAIGAGHPLWRGLLEGDEDYLSHVHIYGAWPFVRQDDQPAVPLMVAGEDERPVILDSTFGHGRLLTIGTSATTAWNDLPLRKVFVGIANQAIAHLLEVQRGASLAQVGESPIRLMDFRSSQATYRLTDPQGEETALSVRESDGDYLLELPVLNHPGFYELQNLDNASDRFLIAVNTPAKEGRIAALAATELANIYEPLGVTVATPDNLSDLSGGGTDIAWLILAVMLLCWLGENLLAMRISRR